MTIKEIKKLNTDYLNACESEHKMNELFNYVLELQKHSEQRKIGHWIMTGDYFTGAYGDIDYVECSCCHEESLEEGDYCPNCGAKMIEE